MKKLIFFCLIITTIPLVPEALDIPSSSRSRAAISRVNPKLHQEFANKGVDWGAPVFMRIFKDSKELEVWVWNDKAYKLFKIYKICTYGQGTLGPKTEIGDGQAPEGFYFVNSSKMNPWSDYHLSFNLGYPNRYDRIHGRTGGALMVHGSCVSIGCYAMTNDGIEEIYALADAALRNGQGFFRVHVFPFRMTEENMNKHSDSKWREFWKNLREGYEYFEKNGHVPPNVKVKNKKYVFEDS